MRHIAKHKLASNFTFRPNQNLSLYEECLYGKMAQKKFPHRLESTSQPLQLIHTDLCGPLPERSLTQNIYFITFIDDFTRFTIFKFLKDKSGPTVLRAFQQYHTFVSTQLELQIKSLQSDNGSEYINIPFRSYCESHGIFQRFTVPSTPQQNGLAERKNQTLLDSAQSLLAVAGLSNTFWEEAVATACYLQNRTYSRSIKAIPYTLWFNSPPDYASLRVFGSPCYAYVPAESRHKLDSHATKAIFTGYGDCHGVKGYHLYNSTSKRFFYSRSLFFSEKRSFH
ncbi:hypothetical protein L7F22_047135 [Adiantum nelumboides]|nr:hypothetical protein [Adiantum nelumboides]